MNKWKTLLTGYRIPGSFLDEVFQMHIAKKRESFFSDLKASLCTPVLVQGRACDIPAILGPRFRLSSVLVMLPGNKSPCKPS